MTVSLNNRIARLEKKEEIIQSGVVIIYDPIIPGDADTKRAEANAMGIDTVILIPDNGRSRNEQDQAGIILVE